MKRSRSSKGAISQHSRAAWLALLLATGLTLLLYMIPYGRWALYPLLLISTVVHELGHGLVALAVGGQFHSLQIWWDASGVAQYSGPFSRLDQAAIAAGGLLGPAAVAGLLFICGPHLRACRIVLGVSAGILALACLLWVSNLFGWLFVATLAALLLFTALKAPDGWAQFITVFLAVQLALSVFARGDYLFTGTAVTAAGTMPSDVGQIAQALGLPYLFWGALIALCSLALLAFGLRRYVHSLQLPGILQLTEKKPAAKRSRRASTSRA